MYSASSDYSVPGQQLQACAGPSSLATAAHMASRISNRDLPHGGELCTCDRESNPFSSPAKTASSDCFASRAPSHSFLCERLCEDGTPDACCTFPDTTSERSLRAINISGGRACA